MGQTKIRGHRNMARNFGLGSRDMSKAAQFALNDSVKQGAMGFKHASELAREFKDFSAFAHERGVKDMQYVSRDLVIQYGQQIGDRVSNDEIKEGTAQNKISAINSVMRIATGGQWKSVSPRHECQIDQRSAIRETPPTGLDRSQFERGIVTLTERGAAIAELAREFGLRTKESSLLNAHAALRVASERGVIVVSDGTKGGRPREVPLNPQNAERQLDVLGRAVQAQGSARAVMPPDKNWKEWRENGLRQTRETLQKNGIERLHDLRSAYACERYETLTGGHLAPCLGGSAPRELDRAARLQIAQELGHGRTDITNSYLGAHT